MVVVMRQRVVSRVVTYLGSSRWDEGSRFFFLLVALQLQTRGQARERQQQGKRV